MSQQIPVPETCDILALGEPTHTVPGFGLARNALFAQLAGRGFRSIAIESDRIAALTVDDYVRHGTGSLDAAMRTGFSHDFGALDANRQLVAWMRDYNRDRPAGERLSFHGFDAPTENFSAPSPRPYLSVAAEFLGLPAPDGDDERWSRTEAILDHTQSMGATPEAARLRLTADDLLTKLYAGAPHLIAKTSRAEWWRARTHVDAGLALLHYHWQAAQPLARNDRIGLLLATRDTLMARNLLDIRTVEASRGPTMLFAHNLHLQRHDMTALSAGTFGAGAIVGALELESYFFVAGSLGRSEAFGEPEPDTTEALLEPRVTGWGLIPPGEVPAGRVRASQHGYFPLDQALIDNADLILHVTG